MTDYYVKNGGNDGAAGTSDGTAWETTTKVNGFAFNPNDNCYFKRGNSWVGTPLAPSVSGTSGNPVTFADYGIGTLPTFTPSNGGGWLDNGIFIMDLSWLVFRNLKVEDAEESGVRLYQNVGNVQYNIIDSVEVTSSGYGVTIDHDDNTIIDCYFHDLVMAVNTPGGNDDRGATGVRLYGANNTIANCTFYNCIATSYDYGHDGGGIEIYGTNVDGNVIEQCWFELCCGYVEVASGGAGSCANTVFRHNIVVNSARGYFHLAGVFATTVTNFKIENCTFYEDGSNPRTGQQYCIAFNGVPTGTDVYFRNNIVGQHDANYDVSDENAYTHTFNTYHLTNGAGHGAHINVGSESDDDPEHIDSAGGDFKLLNTSPCIDTGTNLGYTEDYEGEPVPIHGGYDQGAYEFREDPPGARFRIGRRQT